MVIVLLVEAVVTGKGVWGDGQVSVSLVGELRSDGRRLAAVPPRTTAITSIENFENPLTGFRKYVIVP